MEKVVVIGAGIMGQRIARHFMRAGHPVALVDPDARVRDAAAAVLSDKVRLAATSEALGPDWRDADCVIEAVPERLDLKRRVFADLEAFFGSETIIASNTSGLRSADLAQEMLHPERFAIAHFFNPADVIPAVEVVPGPQTAAEVVSRLCGILDRSGKKSAPLGADVPGFIANRLQHALMRECFHLLDSGVADAETIDTVTRYSLGVRLALIGPFLQRDSNGLDTHANIASYLYADLASGVDMPAQLADKVAAGQLGRKSGQGFYIWDSAREAAMARTEALLPEVIALALQNDGAAVPNAEEE